jgi:hypothetical protein
MNSILFAIIGIFIPLITILLESGVKKLPVNVIKLNTFNFTVSLLLPIVWITFIAWNDQINKSFIDNNKIIIMILYSAIIIVDIIFIYKIINLSSIEKSMKKIIILYNSKKYDIVSDKNLINSILISQRYLNKETYKELLLNLFADKNSPAKANYFLLKRLIKDSENDHYRANNWDIIFSLINKDYINSENEELVNLLIELLEKNYFTKNDYEKNRKLFFNLNTKNKLCTMIDFPGLYDEETYYFIIKDQINMINLQKNYNDKYFDKLLFNLKHCINYIISEDRLISSYNSLHLSILEKISKSKNSNHLKKYLDTFGKLIILLINNHKHQFYYEYIDPKPNCEDKLVEIYKINEDMKEIIIHFLAAIGNYMIYNYDGKYIDENLLNNLFKYLINLINEDFKKIIFDLIFLKQNNFDFYPISFFKNNKFSLMEKTYSNSLSYPDSVFLCIFIFKYKIQFDDIIEKYKKSGEKLLPIHIKKRKIKFDFIDEDSFKKYIDKLNDKIKKRTNT